MASVVTGLGGSIGLGENSIWHGSGVDFGSVDDGAVQVDITSVFGAGGIDFFGTSYTSLYINTNGTITFDGPELSFSPVGLAAVSYPAIAPFFTDIDISAYGHIGGANDIYWDLDTANGVFTVTWYEVIPYSGSGNNTFQVRLHDLGGGDFDVEFIYEDIEWTNGGSGVASVGITDGGTNDYVLPGSQNASDLSNYPTTDFGTGDGPGIYSVVVANGAPVCFVAGSRIVTPSGPRAVEDLRAGDHVVCASGRAARLIWTGGGTFCATERFRPICIAAGVLGAVRPLQVSPQHRVRIASPYGPVFVAAKHLVGLPGVTVDTSSAVAAYHHVACATHEIICADGVWCETLLPGAQPHWSPMRALGRRPPAPPGAPLARTALPTLGARDARRLLMDPAVRLQNGFDLGEPIRFGAQKSARAGARLSPSGIYLSTISPLRRRGSGPGGKRFAGSG